MNQHSWKAARVYRKTTDNNFRQKDYFFRKGINFTLKKGGLISRGSTQGSCVQFSIKKNFPQNIYLFKIKLIIVFKKAILPYKVSVPNQFAQTSQFRSNKSTLFKGTCNFCHTQSTEHSTLTKAI